MTRAMEKMLLTDVCLPFGEFPGWETVATGKALNETPETGLDWHYYGVYVSFVRASDKTCIPYGLALFREARSPDGKKIKTFLSAVRHPKNADEFKKQREEIRQQQKLATKALVEKLIAEQRQKEFDKNKSHLKECFRDEILYVEERRLVKNITWYRRMSCRERVEARGYFHSFDHGTTWIGTTCGVWVQANYAGAEAVELMTCGIERNVQTGTRVCLPTTKHGWLEFIIDPETLIDIPADSQHDGRSESAYTLTFTSNDRRTWLLQNCAPQANIPAGKAPLILQMPEIKTAS